MKVYLSSDMEGTAGVVDWGQCRGPGAEYEHYRRLLQDEVNAAIAGAQEAGATEFLVNDAHSSMQNLRPAELLGNARYLSGRHKPLYMMEGLDASFDAVFLVSYHGSVAGEPSTLSHTYDPRTVARVRLNGVEVGEAGINALVALGHGVPVVLVTGDEVTAEETRRVCPDVAAVVVKRSVTRFAAESLHPAEACARIREGAAAAVRGLGTARPPRIELPATLEVGFRTADLAELATRVVGVRRTGTLEVSMTDADPVELYRTFVTVVLLARAIAE
ncbi:D-amino peptidase [Geodermatophilus telluris]|uniref:D-amino peptidase n=1 Tax=Geodermatophilus telluris TaxID=1190417 RepID=A0A1G6QX30_9ACTN|nr:M55 family metallopeptidase [Geodermatophilus telluris]SDC96832.1 D-amino peptidase [Geodermatophilus telluris]